jgi:hypothetical protein
MPGLFVCAIVVNSVVNRVLREAERAICSPTRTKKCAYHEIHGTWIRFTNPPSEDDR